MKDLKNSLNTAYWQSFSLDEDDVERLYNSFLETESPQMIQPLIDSTVRRIIENEKLRLEKLQSKSALFMPKETYQVGDTLEFSAFDMKMGKIVAIRDGHNPDITAFQVIKVEFDDGRIHEFASGIEDHVLNDPILFDPDDPNLNPEHVLSTFGSEIKSGFESSLNEFGGFSFIGQEWFPESLLIDINEGHLNLAEAVLDFNNGEPISATSICEQIGLAAENKKLTEFSLNIALQADSRFDEVGPAGEVLWFLTALEPDEVKEQPKYLVLDIPEDYLSIDNENNSNQIGLFEGVIADEHEIRASINPENKDLTFSLIYPHWRSGTLPLSEELRSFFPSALEAPHIRFTFIDGATKNKFPGWVIQNDKYVCGLKEWYQTQELLPGSLVHIKKGKNPGEVIISADKKRSSRQWIRVAKLNENGKLGFSMDMSSVKGRYNDRMILSINDLEKLDQLWLTSADNFKFEQTVRYVMRELMKLNPQGHVHAQELYAATNLILRTPPRAILTVLNNADWISHQGDLYFRLEETNSKEANSDG